MFILNSLIRIIGGFFSFENYTLKNFILCILIMMLIQYIPLEGYGVSPLKVAIMLIACFVLFTNFRLSKAAILLLLFIAYKFFTAYFINGDSFRSSTFLYSILFVVAYIVLYNGIHVDNVLSLDFFIKFIKIFILVEVTVLVLQQIYQLMGFTTLPIINLTYHLNRGFGAYALSLEPSHLARVLCAVYYAYLKCCEYKQDHSVTIQQVFNKEHRIVTIAFLWAMFTMSSGTAFICLGVLSLYFMRGVYFIFTIPIFFTVYSALSYFEVREFKRARDVTEATMTGESDRVRETDGSAAARIEPLLNTLHDLDINKAETWFGHGIDYNHKVSLKKGKRKQGTIDDYGLIGYGLGMTFIYICAIEFFSLANVMLLLGIGGGAGNIAYQWGLLMIFTIIRYFHQEYKNADEDD